MTEQKVACYKFTLPSLQEKKKTVTLREAKISDTRIASAVAGKSCGDNQALLAISMQEEMVKLLLVKIDGKELKASEKEALDTLFSLKEYASVLQCVQMITQDEDTGKPIMEIETGGN